MYVSDYMYASGYYSSDDTTTASSSYYGNQNWLYDGNEWTITPKSNIATYSFAVINIGYVRADTAYFGYGVRPTFYLKSSVYIKEGEGTIESPYILACDDCN